MNTLNGAQEVLRSKMSSGGKTTGGLGPASSFDWGEFFPHDFPYHDQVKGIRQLREAAKNNGYYTLEGPCGTGKTTIALTGVLDSIDDSSTTAEKATVVTPLRNQREQFMTELSAINAKREENDNSIVYGMELSGKHEYLPLARNDVGEYADDSVSDYELSAEMTDRANELLTYTSGYEIPMRWYPRSDIVQCPACSGKAPKDLEYCYQHASEEVAADIGISPVRARAIMQAVDDVQHGKDRLEVEVNGETYETPYAAELPLAGHVATFDDDSLAGPFDPFRIGFYAGTDHRATFEDIDDGVMTVDELVERTATFGVCPYRVLYDLLHGDETDDPTVVVGNYQHILNPQIRFLLDGYRGEESLLVIDEAHMLAEKARGLLGNSHAVGALAGASTEWDDLYEAAQKPTIGKDILEILEVHGFEKRSDIKELKEFFEKFRDLASTVVENRTNAEFSGLNNIAPDELPDRRVMSLTEIGDETDDLTKEMDLLVTRNETWKHAYENLDDIAKMLSTMHDYIATEEDDYSSTAAAATYLDKWVNTADRDTYLREVIIEKKKNADPEQLTKSLSRVYNARLNLFSTIPKQALYDDVFSKFGGGIVMSATLAPLDQFTMEVGLDLAEDNGRYVERDVFKNPFPEENRATWVVENNPYVYQARKPPTKDPAQKSGTRKYYEGTLEEVSQTYGNHLYVMPSAEEAEIMADALRESDRVDKPVFVDIPGEKVLDRFRNFPDHAILVTYMNGTVTTGVDFSGDLLHTVAIVGISYPPPSDRRDALVDVYEREMDGGFKYGVTVPAIREARQAMGRVIRGDDEGGVRLLIDSRYQDPAGNVLDCFPSQMLGELKIKSRNELQDDIDGFWDFFHMFS